MNTRIIGPVVGAALALALTAGTAFADAAVNTDAAKATSTLAQTVHPLGQVARVAARAGLTNDLTLAALFGP